MTDLERIQRDLASDSQLLLGIVGRDHQQAAAEIINRLNRNYSAYAEHQARAGAQAALDDYFRQQKPVEEPASTDDS